MIHPLSSFSVLIPSSYRRAKSLEWWSSFRKDCLFSDLNNLADLSVSPLSHDLLGITENELVANFDEYIQRLVLLIIEQMVETLEIFSRKMTFAGGAASVTFDCHQQQDNNHSQFNIVTSSIFIALVFLQLILSCIVDKAPATVVAPPRELVSHKYYKGILTLMLLS